ncbi:MAG: hypothetical protein LBH98_05165 [Chitinispirillales bacterium]|nr:hypothetical protein [Chitinispirillales bacterium]
MAGKPLLSSADLKNYTSTQGLIPDTDQLFKPYEYKHMSWNNNVFYEKPKSAVTVECAGQSNSLSCGSTSIVYTNESEINLISKVECDGLWKQQTNPPSTLPCKCTFVGDSGISILK